MARLPASTSSAAPPNPETMLPEMPLAPPLSPRQAAANAARWLALLEWALAAIVLALAFLIASFSVRNSDFWPHLATGRFIAQGRSDVLLGRDPFSHATQGRHWANHAWLFDLLTYSLYSVNQAGKAVVAVKALLVALTAVIMLLACRPAPRDCIAPGSKANPVAWFAALFTGLALLAMSPRLLMQPTILSFLFLALTFWLLNRDRDQPSPGKLVVPLAALFALWVNCDAWFFLGPGLVLLFLAGEYLQRVFPGADPVPVSPERLKALAIALGVGAIACLVSPHHIHSFALPSELSQSKLAPALLQDDYFRGQFIQPINHQYWTPAFGKTIAGGCYAALLVAGLGAFALNVANLRWSQVLAWAALAGLSLYSWRCIPFFAIVAAPITVLNLHAWFARRAEWSDEPAPAAPSPAAAPGSIRVTPARLAAFIGVMGRLFTLAAGVVALLAAYPGWLTSLGRQVTWNAERHVAWVIEPDEGLKDAAEKIQLLHDSGKMPAEPRGLHFQPDVSNYCAWFAPSEKSFFDLRYPLLADLSEDLVRVRRGLRDMSQKGEAADDWEGVLERRKITHVVITDFDRGDNGAVLSQCWFDDRQWSLWFQNGRAASFGWHDAPGSAAVDPLRLDLVQAAFGPEAERLKPPSQTQSVADAALQHDLLERYFTPPAPQPPHEVQAAGMFLALRDGSVRKAMRPAANAWFLAWAAGEIGLSGAPGYGLTFASSARVGARDVFSQSGVPQLAARQPESVALGVLAVRAAHRAIAAAPEQPIPYLMLGRAYNTFPAAGSQLRTLQLLTTLRQGVARATPADTAGRGRASFFTEAYLRLYDLHLNNGEIDLAVECLEKALKTFATSPPADVPEDQIDRQLVFYEKRLEDLKTKVLEPRREQFELQAARRPAPIQAQMAIGAGLMGEAVRVLEANIGSLDLPSVSLLIRLYLMLGRVADAQAALAEVDQAAPLDAPEQLRLRHEFQLWRIQTAIAGSDFERAGRELEVASTDLRKYESSPLMAVDLGIALNQLVLGDAIGLTPLSRIAAAEAVTDANASRSSRSMVPATLFRLHQHAFQVIELHAWRGMLALEEGDNSAALLHLEQAVNPILGAPIPFPGRGNAQTYVELLKKEATTRK